MAAIKQVFGSNTSVTITLNSLASAASATSNEINFGSPGPFAVSFEFTVAGNSASNTDELQVFVQWGNATGNTEAQINEQPTGTVAMNGTASVIGQISTPVFARYAKVRVFNNSGDSLASSGNTLNYAENTVDST